MSNPAAETTTAPELPEGMVLYKNTDPTAWGGRISRNGQTIRIGDDGYTLARDDSALHLCGPEWLIVQGEPKIVVVQHSGSVEIRPAPGPMQVWECPPGYGGQRISARDGSVLSFNTSGYALAAENCGLDVVPGYRIVADGSEAEKYQAAAPVSLYSLEETAQQARLSGLGVEPEEDENDAYAALARDLARRTIVETVATEEAASGENAPGEALPASSEAQDAPDGGAEGGAEAAAGEATSKALEVPEGPEPEKVEDPRATLEGQTRPNLEAIAARYGIERPSDFKRYPKNSNLVDAILVASGYEEAPAEDEAETEALDAARKVL